MANPVTAANSKLIAFVERFPDSTRLALTEDGDWEKNVKPALIELAQIVALGPDPEIRLKATRLFMECLYCHARTTGPLIGAATSALGLLAIIRDDMDDAILEEAIAELKKALKFYQPTPSADGPHAS